MSDIGSQLWGQYASLVQNMTSVSYETKRDDPPNEQVLTMLVATPLEADWFGTAPALHASPGPDEGTIEDLLREVDEAVGPQGLLTASGVTIGDPDDIESLIGDDPPEPQDALQPADLDDDGQPAGRGDSAFSTKSSGGSVSGLTPGQQRFLDTMAFLPGQYNPLWAPGSVRAADAYKSLLLNISIGDMDQDQVQQVEKAFKRFNSTKSAYSTIQLDAAKRYKKYRADMVEAGMRPDSAADFLRDNGYTNKLAAAKTKRDADYAGFLQVVQYVGLREDLIQAVANVKSDLPQLFMMDEVSAPPWNNPFSQQSSHSESHTSFSKTTWGLEVSGAYNLITFGGAASGSHEHTTVSTSQIDIEINFAGWKEVRAIPGVSVGDTWFNAAVVSEYVGHLTDNSRNDWAEKSVFAGAEPKRSPYGPRGFLPFWPVGAIVVEHPSFVLTMKKTEYEKNATSWSGGASIGIGPFKFGPKVSHSNIQIDEEGDSMKVTLTDSSDIPKVLAIQMQVFPPSSE